MPEFNTAEWNGGGSAVASGMLSVSAQSIFYGALRLIGVLRPGQDTSPEAKEDGLAALNELIDSWNTERLVIYAIARDVWDLTAGRPNYTIGDQSARPVRIERAAMLRSADNPVEYSMEILTLQRFADGLPGLYNDNAHPEATLTVQPPPSGGDKLVLYSWQPLQMFGDLTTLYTFPPGYALALRYNLAVQIAPQFVMSMKTERVMMASVEEKAIEYKAKIKALNVPVYVLKADNALLSRGFYDISTGGFL